MIIARAPFRISFFGGGTDFPEYYREHGGAVLTTSIDQFAYLTVHRLSPFFKHRYRASYAKTESVRSPNEFEHPLIRECLLHLDIQEGVELAHVADLPGRTGLGTSSSFTVALLHALHTFRNEDITPAELAREAVLVERQRVGDAGGHQDQYIAAYGGFRRIDFRGDQKITVRSVSCPPDRLRELQDRLLLFYLGTEMSAESILREQTRRIPAQLADLREMKNMVDTAQLLLEGGGAWTDWGALLHESWMRKRRLADGVSNGTVDTLYATARKAGASGGKVLGAGGRGFLCFFVEPDAQAAVRKSLGNLMEVPVSFSSEGSRIIFRSPK